MTVESDAEVAFVRYVSCAVSILKTLNNSVFFMVVFMIAEVGH